MKLLAPTFAALLAVGLLATPSVSQDADPDPTASGQACLLVSADRPLDGLTPTEIGELLVDGTASVRIVRGEACGPEATTDRPEASGTPYVAFVAHAAGAAIELAALAERHEGADSLSELDGAARSLAAWSKKQRRWLDRHPPQACYADVHAQWRQGLVEVRQGAKAVRVAIEKLKAAPMERAVRKLSSGTGKLADADLESVADACVAAATPPA